MAKDETHAIVLIFAATDCPISNRYIPEINRLQANWQAKGVAFRWVFPNPNDTAAIVQKTTRDFNISAPILIDSHQMLVRLAHVSVTPEAAVFTVTNGALREQYHGRIDDRYIAFDKQRPQAAHHDLEEVLKALSAGRAAPKPVASPVGCSIVPLTVQP